MSNISTRAKKTFLLSLAVVAFICFIFFNSAQTGEESSRSSGFVTGIIKWFLDLFGITPDGNSLSFIVRKTAHFGEYFILSLLCSALALSVFEKKKYIALAPMLAFSVALCDEFIVQGSTAGRSPEWRDVLIDLSGAVIASLLLALFVYLRARRLCKKEKTK